MVSKLTFPTTQNQVLGKVNEIIDGKQDILTAENAGANISIAEGSRTFVVKGTGSVEFESDQLNYVKAYGGTKQGLPSGYTQVNYVTNTIQTEVDTGIAIDMSKSYVFEYRGRAVTGSWYILQARRGSTEAVYGLSGANAAGNFLLCWGGGSAISTTNISRSAQNIDHIYYVRGEVDGANGTLTLYVKDETSDVEETVTGTCAAGQGLYPTNIGLLGNLLGSQMVRVDNYVYMARIKEDGVAIMDYVPARQGATAGFYDRVSGTFKTAETPENLSAGSDAVPTPAAPMDIMCNNGVLKVNSQGQIYTDGTVETIKDSLNNTATAEILLSIDDYTDVQEILSGTVTRKVGVLALDGTENWSYLTSSGYERFSYALPNLSINANSKKILLCNYYEPFPASSVYFSKPTYSCWIEDGRNLRFHNNDYTTVASWKAYLAAQYAAGTPVIIVYPLATETTESVAGQTLQVTSGTNTLEITQASLTGLELEAEYTKKTGSIEISFVNNDGFVKQSDLATVATSGSYDDLSDKPTIPTVNNPTITFKQGGVTKGSFTLNQTSDDTIELDAGGGGGSYSAGDGIDITNNTISLGDIDCGIMA